MAKILTSIQKIHGKWLILVLALGSCNLPGLDRFLLDISTLNLFLRLSEAPPSLGGEVTGLLGTGLRLNAEIRTPDDLTNQTLDITSNGRFQFPQTPPGGSTYSITILSQPTDPNQLCEVGGATGTMGRSAVTNILVQCGESLEVAMPSFSPPPGEFPSATNVSISTTEALGKIFYTTNGTNPACNPDGTGVGTEFTAPILVPQPSLAGLEIRAIVCLPEKSSNVQTGLFRVTNGQLVMAPPSLAPGSYATSPQVTTLNPPATPPPGTTIRYTVDGTIPTCSSPIAPNPINMVVSTTIRAIACAPDWTASNVAEFAYIITGTVTEPTLNFFTNTYPDGINLSLSVPIPGASIRYAITTDGSNPIPNCTSSTLYTAPIPISTNNTKLSAIGCLAGWTDSAPTVIETYSFQVANPVLSPTPPMSVTTSQMVTASTTTSSATIRYTDNGAVPDCNTSSTTPPTITADNIESNITVHAIACRTGFTQSGAVSGTYTKTGTLAPPAFTPLAGTMPPGNITLNDGAGNPPTTDIRYRTDGAPATCSDMLYTAPIPLATSTTITAISCRPTPLWNPSSSESATYTITGTLATPTFTPAADTYNDTQSVTIASNAGSTIYYNLTTDGSLPTPPGCSSGLTTQPISVTQNDTRISAIACQSGWANSVIDTAVFTLRPDAPTPNFPNSTSFGNAATISFTSSTGTTFRIVEGPPGSPPADPICALADPGTNSITIPAYPSGGASRSVKAIACRGNFADSLVTSLLYFVNGPVPAPTLSPTLDSANQVTVSANTAPPAPGMQALCYRIGADPECSSTLNGTPNTLGQSCALGSTVYNSGVKPILTMTSDFRVRACSLNHEQSTVVQNTFTISGTVGAVSATPPPGTVNNDPPNITLSSPTTGAVIYYTTNGTNPSCTGVGSLNYSVTSAFPLSPSSPGAANIKAIACAPGLSPSPVADFNYTFQVGTPTTVSTGGPKNNDESVTILPPASTPAPVTIRYRLDGVAPTDCLDGTLYSGAINLPSAAGSPNVGLRAIACKTNYQISAVLSRDYQFQTATPVVLNNVTGAIISSVNTSTPPITIRFTTGTTGGRLCLDVKPHPTTPNPTCNGGSCGPGMINLGLDTRTYNYTSTADISTAVRVCKADYTPNTTLTTRNFLVPTTPTFRAFVSNQTMNGGLGGATGADSICNLDFNRPFQGVPYLAFISSASPSAPRSTSMNNPLMPNAVYTRNNEGVPIFATNAVGVPLAPLTNPWSTVTQNVWTGFNTTFGVDSNCNNWTININASSGRRGNANLTTTGWLDSSGVQTCDIGFQFYCLESRYRIWVTGNIFQGDFGGITGGDSNCNNVTDPNHPKSGRYKALLLLGTRVPGGGDWPLKSNTAYYRSDRTTLIGITDNLGRFTKLDSTPGLENSFAGILQEFWTGGENDFQASSLNCSNFTDTAAGSGSVGSGNQTTPFQYVRDVDIGCNLSARLLCVEQ